MKRQQASITPDDVIILDSPFIHDGELLVPFVVGQSAPVSGSVLTDLLHNEGPRLATALATAVRTVYRVYYLGAEIFDLSVRGMHFFMY